MTAFLETEMFESAASHLHHYFNDNISFGSLQILMHQTKIFNKKSNTKKPVL